MLIEPKFEKVANSNRIKLGVTQAVIECKLPVTEDNNIAKILCANAKSYIVANEVELKEITYNGNVNFQVIYENEENDVASIDYTAEFKDKFISDDITVDLVPILTSNVVDIHTQIVGNDVKVVAIVEICVDGILNENIDVLADVNGENVYTKQENLLTTQYLGMLNDKFEIDNDIEIKDNILKVLEVCMTPYIENVEVKDKIAVVKGGANIDICYLTNGEQSLLKTYQENIAFSQEVALDELVENCKIQSQLDINYSLIKVTTNIDADNAIVNLSIPFDYKGYAFVERELEVVADLFSTNNYLNVCTTSFNTIKCYKCIFDESKVEGNVLIEDNYVDEILGTCCNSVTLANSFIKDSNLILEGVASTTVIYYNKETNSTYSQLVEMPFSNSIECEDLKDNEIPIINLSMGDVVCRLKRGGEIEVTASLFSYVCCYNNINTAVITKVEDGEDKINDGAVLSIYVVKENESLWDVAKNLNINPDEILLQNENVELPLVGGEKLVIYRQKEIKY